MAQGNCQGKDSGSNLKPKPPLDPDFLHHQHSTANLKEFVACFRVGVVSGLEVRVQGSGLRVSGLLFRWQGRWQGWSPASGFRVSGLRFRVLGTSSIRNRAL